MHLPQVVLDTNVLVAGLRSRRGAAFHLLQLVGSDYFQINLSVPLVLEYEEVLLRQSSSLMVSQAVVADVIDYHCQVARQHQIFYLWRPFLRDPKDDMVLEVAVTGQCDWIITFNKRDFYQVDKQFGVQIGSPIDFLREIGVEP